MLKEDFDFRQTVILEDPPGIAPGAERGGWIEPGTVRLTESSTDHLVVEAELSLPAVLLITDAYSRHWRATPLPGSTQREYRLVPGDYCLQAVPLQAGRHRIRIEYAPWAFRVGKWVSIVALVGYCGAWLAWAARRAKKRRREPVGPPAAGTPAANK